MSIPTCLPGRWGGASGGGSILGDIPAATNEELPRCQKHEQTKGGKDGAFGVERKASRDCSDLDPQCGASFVGG